MSTFTTFKRELALHDANGYHQVLSSKLTRPQVEAWLSARGLKPTETYVDFLCEVGPGRYFDGNLTIFPLDDTSASTSKGTVESELRSLKEISPRADLLPFGYDGSTEISFCLRADSRDENVYVFSWQDGSSKRLNVDFANWIESRPKKLFNSKMYSNYKPIGNPAGAEKVVLERAAFVVRLLSFNPSLVRERADDFLPRFNEVVLEVTLMRKVSLRILTILVERRGSKYGDRNVWHVSLPVGDLVVGVPTILRALVFDPYNVPFNDIAIRFEPNLDLGSPDRSKYKELAAFL